MRHFLVLVLAALAVPALHAQDYKGHAYGYFGLGAPRGQSLGDFVSYGGGGDMFVWRNLTAGGDVGFLAPREDQSEGIGIANINAGWQFVNRRNPGKLVPFVSGGLTIGFRSGAGYFANYGGGVHYWFARHAGARIEVRDYEGYSSNGRFNTELRFGVVFR